MKKHLLIFILFSLISMTANSQVRGGHEYVDLGLSVKWATMNIGASKPEEYGDYFAWGEGHPKRTYTDKNYDYHVLKRTSITDEYDEGELSKSDDVVQQEWGFLSRNGNDGIGWRMPTREEMGELTTKCNWIGTTLNGVYGFKITGPSGNSIFLPAAGYKEDDVIKGKGEEGYYWGSSSYRPSWTSSSSSHRFQLTPGGSSLRVKGGRIDVITNYHVHLGYSVRAVCDINEQSKPLYLSEDMIKPAYAKKHNGYDYVDLGLSVKWATSDWKEDETYSLTRFALSDFFPMVCDPIYNTWGEGWRIPSKEELIELVENCNFVLCENDTKKGYLATSRINGNSIFLPISRYTSEPYGYIAKGTSLSLGPKYAMLNHPKYPLLKSDGWWDGLIRPVFKEGEVLASTIAINNHQDTMFVGDSFKLSASITPSNATDNELEWEAWELIGGHLRDTSIATISPDGVITAKRNGKVSIQAFTKSKTALSDVSEIVIVKPKNLNRHDFVDLGLSVMWATCNVGAEKEEEFGEGLKYGEAKKTVALWGDGCRMPTKREMKELLKKCTWTWTSVNHKKGYKVTSKLNGNSIFLPAASYEGIAWAIKRYMWESHERVYYYRSETRDCTVLYFCRPYERVRYATSDPKPRGCRSKKIKDNIIPRDAKLAVRAVKTVK